MLIFQKQIIIMITVNNFQYNWEYCDCNWVELIHEDEIMVDFYRKIKIKIDKKA